MPGNGMKLILSEVAKNASGLENTTSSNGDTFEIQNNANISAAAIKESLNGSRLTVATINDYPLNYRVCESENKNCTWQGVSFQILDFLAEKFNFTYNVVAPKRNIIGSSKDMEGSLLELMGNKTADFAAAFLPLLADARKHVYYSTTSLDEGEWIMIMRRPTESASGSGLLAPFEQEVWFLILVSLLAVGPIIYFLIIIRNKLTGDDKQKPYPLSHCAWFVYGALMKQGSTLSPIADSTRLLFATWWIFITILTSFYTANLTAFLTLSKFTLPINAVEDILKNEQRFVSIRGGAVEYSIKNADEALNILNRMVQKNKTVFTENLNDSITLINFVQKNDFVFVRDRPAIDHLIYSDYRERKAINMDDEKAQCPFAVSKTPFMTKKRSFAYPRNNFILSSLFDPELLNLVESGIVKYLISEGLPRATICPQDLGGTERQLRNGDLLMTYYIMLAGFATSTVVFCSELIFRYLNKKKLQNASTSNISRMIRQDKSNLFFVKTVTPPPPYASIFHRSKNVVAAVGGIRPPQGEISGTGMRRIINGRDYMVFRGPDGERTLVPARAPSATLFQYAYTE